MHRNDPQGLCVPWDRTEEKLGFPGVGPRSQRLFFSLMLVCSNPVF